MGTYISTQPKILAAHPEKAFLFNVLRNYFPVPSNTMSIETNYAPT